MKILSQVEISKICEIAKSAGHTILDIYNSDDFEVEIKNDNSPLTKADKASNEMIVTKLKDLFLDIHILSEEEKEIDFYERKDWKRFWCVDPLDGTKEFIKRNGEFTVNIALVENNKPIFGVIYVPVTGELYYGGKETGSFKVIKDSEPVKLKVSSRKPEEFLNVVQSRSHSGDEENKFYSKYKINERLSKGSSLKICLIAEGKAELYFRGGSTWEWDTAAGHAILLGAGGYFVNKDKSELVYNKEIIKNFGFIASSFKIEE